MPSFWKSLAVRVVFAIVGVAAAVFSAPLLIGHTGLGELERVRELGEQLREDACEPRRDRVLLLGNSVTTEGLDAELVGDAGPFKARNYAIAGSRLEDTLIILPRVAATEPRRIVLSLTQVHLGPPFQSTETIGRAYAMAGFVNDWPAEDRPSLYDHFAPKPRVGLTETAWQRWVALRNEPARGIDRALRGAKGIAGRDHWVRPFRRTTAIPEDRLREDILGVRRMLAELGPPESRAEFRTLRAIADICRDFDLSLTVVLVPVHPELVDDSRLLLDEAARQLRESGVEVLDARDLLSATAFHDALHPNEAGRIRWSRWLGERIADEQPQLTAGEYGVQQ